jgi:hypothetical protein
LALPVACVCSRWFSDFSQNTSASSFDSLSASALALRGACVCSRWFSAFSRNTSASSFDSFSCNI